ncbi:MAG: glycerol-3-phosphate 1-O-acyltransferase PlsY [Oscillospiraceae bacterium]|nr:glycerol-3-phosphate 1-O-acyltransferase PlsY [Oscillospiraceae bacterium]
MLEMLMPLLYALWFAMALVGYLLGCVNGALLTSKVFYHDDVRKHGSGNAGLTNFYRTYGAKYAWCVIAVDLAKAAVAVALGAWVIGDPHGKYFMGFWVVVGHMFPAFYKFKGGKGILCSGMTLIMIDWRIALVGWGLFALLWAATKYVSLGSVCAAVSFPIMTWAVYHAQRESIGYDVFTFCFVLSLLMAGLVLWAHRGNIKRLLNGTESKFQWHKE